MIPSESKVCPQQHGVLVLNKPAGPTSNHCLMTVKRFGQRKIGHAGTLDPMAEGVLLVLLGKATRISSYLLEGGQKVYAASVELGRETDTWDTEGTVLRERSWQHVTPAMVREVIDTWRGDVEQIVPPFSAAKSNGTPLYQLAREGRDVPVKTKFVHIHHVEILSMDLPVIHFRVRCGSGTYIRSLAHSLGMRLMCGAVLAGLTREYSHPFALSDAVSLDTVLAHPLGLADYVRPLESALPEWPVVELDAARARQVRDGIAVPCPGSCLDAVSRNCGRALLKDDSGLLALARLKMDRGRSVLAVARGLWS